MTTKKEQLHTSIIFDIDSASVGVAVVGYKEGKTIPIREYYSARTELDTHLSFEDFFARTLRVFQEVANEALIHSPADIDSIYVAMGTPWVSSQKRTAHYKRKKPFVLNKELAEEIIKKEIKDPLSKNLDYHEHRDLRIFERRSIDIYVNGYPTLKPFDEKREVSDVDIHSLTSVISGTTKEAFVHTIQRVFHREPQCISNTFVLYQALRTFIPNENSAMILDLGGTNTQMYVVHDDHLQDIASFPVGREHLIEDLATRLAVGKGKARSLVRLYTQEMLDEEYQAQLSLVMDAVYRNWMRAWYELCDELSMKKLLPSTICLVAPADTVEWLRYHLLKSDELSEHIHTGKLPRVINLSHFLQVQAEELKATHLSDPEMVPVIDVVGSLIFDNRKNHGE